MKHDDSFALFKFQEEAAEALRTAALNWVSHAAQTGRPKYGVYPIPFVGQLKAVTGSGKTPILADVVAGLGHAVVLWTSKSAAVVEQTYQNLRGKYRPLLPKHDVRVIREIPSHADWQHLLNADKGLTIWLMTTAAWNEAEAAKAGGDAKARLSLHRPQQDLTGSRSPWDLLRTDLVRPLWIVSDESHNQSSIQLELLANLTPVGFFLASATPVQNELFMKWREALDPDPAWRALADAAVVPVRTRDVVAAELLKTTLDLYDNNSGYEEDLDDVLATMKTLDAAVDDAQASVSPKAIYVVERSNPPKGSPEEARPVAIWRYLRSKGVETENIAIYTNTRDLPEDAEAVSSLSQLQPRHRHIIFNQALQEGWDDPEAYVCYFDGQTRSFVRIRQIVGRILRQPRARFFEPEVLNTATIFINTPTDDFETVLSDLKQELRLYAPDDEPDAVPVRIRTKKNPLPPIALKPLAPPLTLPRWSLSAPDMSHAEKKLRSRGASPWAQEFLDSPGEGRKASVSLADEEAGRVEMLEILRSARTRNGVYLRRRLLARNRACTNAVHPDAIVGPAFEQDSCQGSLAQEEMEALVDEIASSFEVRVGYEVDPDPDKATWTAAEHRPRSGELLDFVNAVHPQYAKADFNTDELQFARALDAFGQGAWLRNPSTSELGYGLPLPVRVGDSSRFFPDFLWSSGTTMWAIDTTGRHLLSDKVRGKLLDLTTPRLALVVRGKVDVPTASKLDNTGWTAVLPRPQLGPLVEHSEDLQALLKFFADAS